MAYTTIAEMRTLDGMDDETAYPDAVIQEGIDFATELIDNYCGVSFEHKPFTVTLDGSDHEGLHLGILYPQTLTSVTVDGVATPTTGWVMEPYGRLIRNTGSFTYTFPGRNVVVTGTAGITATPPADIRWAARTIARQYVLDLHSRLPERGLSVQSEMGTIQIAQAGSAWDRPTSMPDVNAVLVRHRHKAPTCF